jgi:hypothetical protein
VPEPWVSVMKASVGVVIAVPRRTGRSGNGTES